MRTLLLAALALVATAFAASPAAAGDPVSCRYDQAALARACRADPGVRAYLMDQRNAGVENLMDIPPSVRGWAPGEEEEVIRLANASAVNQAAGCDYVDPLVALACRTNPLARDRLATVARGRNAIWFDLGPEIGGYPPPVMNRALLSRDPAAVRRAMSWSMNLDLKDQRVSEVEGVVGRATRQNVTIVRLSIISVDATNFVACGYLFSDGGGYEDESSGAFIFDTRGNSMLRADPSAMRARCAAADAVLR